MGINNGILKTNDTGLSWSIINTLTAPGQNPGFTTASTDSTGSNLIIITINFGSSLVPTPLITDSPGNTYLLAINANQGTSPNIVGGAVYYCYLPTTSAVHTFNVPAFCNIGVICLAGSLASPVDATNGVNSSLSLSISPGSITPTLDGEFIVFVISNYQSAATPPVLGGWTNIYRQRYIGASRFNGAAYYLIQTPAAPINPAVTVAPQLFQSGIIVSFK